MADKVRVLMLKTTKGSEDGLNVTTFMKDETYTIDCNLAKAFMEDAACELVECGECEKKEEAPEETLDPDVEENKADATEETKPEGEAETTTEEQQETKAE